MLFGCLRKPNNELYEIINDNFLNFVDTFAYTTHKLILNPNDTSLFQSYSNKEVFILIDTMLVSSRILNKSLSTEIKDQNIEKFDDLLIDGETTPAGILDLSRITRTGKYVLVPSIKQKKMDAIYAGQIRFSKPFIKGDKAIVILSVWGSQKAGRSVAYFLKNDDRKWRILNKVELERW